MPVMKPLDSDSHAVAAPFGTVNSGMIVQMPPDSESLNRVMVQPELLVTKASTLRAAEDACCGRATAAEAEETLAAVTAAIPVTRTAAALRMETLIWVFPPWYRKAGRPSFCY
ncbi:hypothetical protein GCM10009839_46820 [Catenulispora yoronensis]|uniref:Uncharacterized protein n=1 Tax=Catenulispora yoronensis TaxID=450799 RepID=A0ABN2UKK7_9ACTN